MRRRFPLSYSEERGYFIDLPHYIMVPGTFEADSAKVCHKDGVHPKIEPADALRANVSVLIDLPDGTVINDKGEIDRVHLRRKYGSGSAYGNRDYKPPKILGER
jgi:hypothetical protein